MVKPRQRPAAETAQLLSREVKFEGWRKLEIFNLKPRSLRHDGWAAEMSREIYSIGRVAAILLYCPETDEILLNQQFRVGAWAMDAEDPFLLECVMGMIDKDEDAEEAARREAVEETGAEVRDAIFVGSFYPTPGTVAEEIYVYIGRIDKPQAGIFGLESEAEEIKTHLFPANDVICMMDEGKIKNGMAMVAISWFARHKDKIQSAWSKK